MPQVSDDEVGHRASILARIGLHGDSGLIRNGQHVCAFEQHTHAALIGLLRDTHRTPHGKDAKANQRDSPPLASAQPSLTRTGACRFLPFTFGIAATVYPRGALHGVPRLRPKIFVLICPRYMYWMFCPR